MPDRLVALVTGAARRIGAAIARSLHAAGYNLVLHYRNSADEAEALRAELEAARPGSAIAVAGELADPATPARLVETAVARFGRLDALVNNASLYFSTPLAEATPEQWDQLFAVNARAPFFLAQAAAPHLRKARGAVVNITDIYAERPARDMGPYAASKAGLLSLTRSLALELAPEVRVNAVAPGAIDWPDMPMAETRKKHILDATPLGRLGSRAEVAEAVVWLLSAASFTTGHIVRVDGGRNLAG